MIARQFVTDCEGPISRNDNAFELSGHFIPDGDGFFARVSRYDDFLADIAKRPGYKAGDTLKLILPFLKAYGAANGNIRDFSARNILLVPGAGETLQWVNRRMASFIISTSYQPYIQALCSVVDFPLERTYSTKLDIDKYVIGAAEVEHLKRLREKIASLPLIELPPGAASIEDLSAETREAIRVLDQIFWEEVPAMEAGKMVAETNPIGGAEKANALLDSLQRTGNGLEDVLYVGDSITDVQALNLVKEGGGLAVSFNGNGYAIRAAEVACISGHTIVTSTLADGFARGGRKAALEVVNGWSHSGLKSLDLDETLVDTLFSKFPETLPKVEVITDSNRELLTGESERFRKTVRGEGVGRLG